MVQERNEVKKAIKMSSARPINAILRKDGETVTVMPRTASVDESTGAPTFTYPEHNWFNAKALVYDASGLREEWFVIGKQDEVDYIASFSASYRTLINPGDRIKRYDGTLTIVELVIERGRGRNIDFLEILLTRAD